MTDTTKKKRKLLLPVAIGVLAILVIGFFVSRAGLDKALVKQQLDATIATIQERARTQGRDVKITYGDIEIAGGVMDKRVVVHSLALRVRPLEPSPMAPDMKAPASDSMVVTSDEMVIYPKSMDLSSALYSLPKPLNFVTEDAPEKSLMKIEASSPIEVTLTQTTKNGVPHLAVSHVAPSKIDMTYLIEQKAEGVEDKAPVLTPVYDVMTLNIGSGKIDTDTTMDGSNMGSVTAHYKDITLTPKSAPEGVISINAIKAEWSNLANGNDTNTVRTVAEVGPITGPADLLPLAPIQFGLDFAFVGHIDHPGDAPDAEFPESTITLSKMDFTSKETNFTAKGEFSSKPGDIMPNGSAQVKWTNVPYAIGALKKYRILVEGSERFYVPILEQITGQSFAEIKELDVAVERQPNGSFKVGKTTFEELFAIVMKEAMRGKGIPTNDAPLTTPTGIAPKLPSADKPRSAPIAVPDNGVRG